MGLNKHANGGLLLKELKVPAKQIMINGNTTNFINNITVIFFYRD